MFNQSFGLILRANFPGLEPCIQVFFFLPNHGVTDSEKSRNLVKPSTGHWKATGRRVLYEHCIYIYIEKVIRKYKEVICLYRKFIGIN